MNSIEDRTAIRELYGRYAVASAKQDLEGWIACWSKDARWTSAHFDITGHDALRQQWAGIWTGFKNVAAFNEIGEVRFGSDDTATSACAVLEMITLADGKVMTMAGLYEDSLLREDGAWRFSGRAYAGLSQA